ncbi:MAG TPA: hypothetical protein VGO93_12245 [Candidatus Xenobia bacterium]|jgi:hypothetical protein
MFRIRYLLFLCFFLPAWSAPEPWRGATVELSRVLPGSPRYLMTDQGDVFDLCHRAGLNALRLIGPSATADWPLLAERARVTGVALLVVVSLKADPDLLQAIAAVHPACIERSGAGGSLPFSPVDLGDVPFSDTRSSHIAARVAAEIDQSGQGQPVLVEGWGQPPDPRPEIRREAFWALTRGVSQAHVPVAGLIYPSLLGDSGLFRLQGIGKRLEVRPDLVTLASALGGNAAGAQSLMSAPPLQLTP